MGRPDEFRRLFRQNYASLMGYAMRRTSLPADAEDAVAEVFAVAWRRIDEVPQDEHEARLWLYGVARRTLANHRRTIQRADRLRLRLASDSGDAPAGASGGDDPGHTELAMWALAQLTVADQELVRLALWEELSHSEIATVIGTSVPNVAVRLHRAKKRLKRLFDGHLQGQPRHGHEASTRTIGRQQGQESGG